MTGLGMTGSAKASAFNDHSCGNINRPFPIGTLVFGALIEAGQGQELPGLAVLHQRFNIAKLVTLALFLVILAQLHDTVVHSGWVVAQADTYRLTSCFLSVL